MNPEDFPLVRAESVPAPAMAASLLSVPRHPRHRWRGGLPRDAFERPCALAGQRRAGPAGGVLLTVHRNRQRDRWRSARSRGPRPGPGGGFSVALDDVDHDAVPDRRLELMLVCAHPDRADGTHPAHAQHRWDTRRRRSRASTRSHTTTCDPAVRAKNRIRDNRIPFRIPDRSSSLSGWTRCSPRSTALVIDWSTGPTERDLLPESLHLAEVLAELVPGDPEARGLAALVGLSAARRAARTGPDGSFLPLAAQDPTQWDRGLIARAHEHLRAAHPARVLGRYQLEAAVQAVHCARATTGHTDWQSLLELHRSLHAVAPSLGSAVALAAVTAEVEGAVSGLALLDAIETSDEASRAARFQPLWATRAGLLDRTDRHAEAAAAYQRAIGLTYTSAERRFSRARDDPRGRDQPPPSPDTRRVLTVRLAEAFSVVSVRAKPTRPAAVEASDIAMMTTSAMRYFMAGPFSPRPRTDPDRQANHLAPRSTRLPRRSHRPRAR